MLLKMYGEQLNTRSFILGNGQQIQIKSGRMITAAIVKAYGMP